MEHNFTKTQENISLRPLCENDLENLRQWRNDKDLSKYLSPVPHITSEQQQKWFEQWRNHPTGYLFAIEFDGALVGSVALDNVEGGSGEFGRFMLSGETRGKGVGRLATQLTLKIAVEQLGLRKVWATVHQKNSAAIITYLKSGFVITGNEKLADDEYQLIILYEVK